MNSSAGSSLSVGIVRMLNDKLYERRKVAALEIEKLIRGLASDGKNSEIQNTVTHLAADFTLSQNPNSRKGGLIGLAACAIGLGSQNIPSFLENLLKPVLICSADQDSRIRYFACESLYNIVKVSRSSTLPYFNELFDVLSKLSSDPDANVRSGSELLDRLLKDIVTETPAFDIAAFVALMRERLYTKKPHTRRFLVQWLTCIMSIPEIDTLAFLPEFLDALFLILDDKSKEIKGMCKTTLDEFLIKIGKESDRVDFNGMINIVVTHCQSTDPIIKGTALGWLNEFINFAGPQILKFSSGVISAILSNLACEDPEMKNVKETAKRANQSLMKLITSDYDCKDAEDSFQSPLPLEEMIGTFTIFLSSNSTLTKCSVLRWITQLLVQIPYSIFVHIDRIFPVVMKRLSDHSEDVVQLTLECLAELASSPAGQPIEHKPLVGTRHNLNTSTHSVTSPLVLNVYFTKFIGRLLLLFKTENNLLEVRSTFIITQLCALLHAENVFRALAESLAAEESSDEGDLGENPKFCAQAVKKLNSILMTSSELAELRDKLKNGKEKETNEFFCCLYRSWCHNAVATITLCLLTQNYKHCCRLLRKFSDFELTVEFLVELDKLVQLLESPIFAYLRLQLLESPCRRYLTKSLYSLLMLLPQTRSYDTLCHRLNSVPNPQLLPDLVEHNNHGNRLTDVDFDNLYERFITVQQQHTTFRKYNRLQATGTVRTT